MNENHHPPEGDEMGHWFIKRFAEVAELRLLLKEAISPSSYYPQKKPSDVHKRLEMIAKEATHSIERSQAILHQVSYIIKENDLAPFNDSLSKILKKKKRCSFCRIFNKLFRK